MNKGAVMTKGSATIYDVAELASVSIATVSRVINGGAHVRPEVRDRVDVAIRNLDFVPSSAARSLSGGKKFAIGLAYPLYEKRAIFGSSPEEESYVLYTDAIIRGASVEAAKLGYSVYASAVRVGDPSAGSLIHQLSGVVDGLILTDRVISDVGAMRFAKRLRAVHLSGSGTSTFGATVRADNESGMRELVDHLATVHKVKDFGFVRGIELSQDAEARYEAFCAAVAAHHGTIRPENVLAGDFSMLRTEDEFEQRLSLNSPLPQAMVCANDQMAFGVMHKMEEHNLRVPEDLIVTGFDDVAMSRTVGRGLTTIRQSVFELGAAAVDTLVGLLDNEIEKGSMITLPTNLVVRGTCGCSSEVSA